MFVVNHTPVDVGYTKGTESDLKCARVLLAVSLAIALCVVCCMFVYCCKVIFVAYSSLRFRLTWEINWISWYERTLHITIFRIYCWMCTSSCLAESKQIWPGMRWHRPAVMLFTSTFEASDSWNVVIETDWQLVKISVESFFILFDLSVLFRPLDWIHLLKS
jgi:hypothetical protein